MNSRLWDLWAGYDKAWWRGCDASNLLPFIQTAIGRLKYNCERHDSTQLDRRQTSLRERMIKPPWRFDQIPSISWELWATVVLMLHQCQTNMEKPWFCHNNLARLTVLNSFRTFWETHFGKFHDTVSFKRVVSTSNPPLTQKANDYDSD